MLYNRELSWLSFNERVLQEARDESVPLVQRLRFLGIYSNNLDEFFKVRVANLERIERIRINKDKRLSGDLKPKEALNLVYKKVLELQKIYEDTYSEILCEMERHNIFVIDEKELNDEQEKYCREYFAEVISPQIVPLMLRKSTKIPFLRDNRIYHAVKMTSGNSARYAIIKIPVNSSSPRFVTLPKSADEKTYIIFADDVIRLCLDEIFFMFDYDTIAAYTFKFTRDAELTLDDDVWKSLIQKMEQGLDNRLHGRPVRMVYDKETPKDLLSIISGKLGLKALNDTNPGGRYHLMKDLMKFPKVNSSLENNNPPALKHPSIPPYSSIMDVIKKKDILLNYPYHTFNHIIDFLREAAVDPKVDSIFITLYRTAERSKIINALINAAKNGKKVTVMLELMARFDEERNIDSSQTLQDAGVRVIHGPEGLKVHSKLILVHRREGNSLRGYLHVGTGNFNEDTAGVYSDFSLLTANRFLAQEAQQICDFLMNTHRHFEFKNLLVSPYFMRNEFEQIIERETKNAKSGKKAYIYAKFNSLTDERIIDRLYAAAKAGVDVRLIIRGSCCLIPQKGVSVISIVDKYLEHARLAIFCNGGNEKVYIMSADWMKRNLDRRVEVGVPILDKGIRKSLKEVFEIQWSDNVKARDLSNLSENKYVSRNSDTLVRSQTELFNFWSL